MEEPPPPFPGEIGFVSIRYTGKAPRVRYWPGPFTGTLYPFGGERRTGYVDTRDAVKWFSQRLVGGAETIWEVDDASYRKASD